MSNHILRPCLRVVTTPLNATSFSTTASSAFTRLNRDRSKLRGVSALRRSPKKIALAAAKFPLPEPVKLEDHKDKLEVNPNHGLWGFFADRQALPTPLEDSEHGRAWTVEELRAKSWEDLHKLWWVCAKELNIMLTQRIERERLKPGEGAHEARRRAMQIKNTQRGIKHALTERYYAWQEAQAIAATDPDVDLSGDRPAYSPKDFEEETLDVSSTAPAQTPAPPMGKPTTL
ncbi:mitochondrial 39-S ribosomal protein L47 (MRP-L47)-domain-containing protein [Morchella snyderi]|nr:mitochondrial 39-S ribosomal protein L47 (MRP-L47)-domain-containing protein [Morchella snyderi]